MATTALCASLILSSTWLYQIPFPPSISLLLVALFSTLFVLLFLIQFSLSIMIITLLPIKKFLIYIHLTLVLFRVSLFLIFFTPVIHFPYDFVWCNHRDDLPRL